MEPIAATTKATGSVANYFLLYIPFVLSMVMSGDAVFSYFVAWAGSLFVFYLSFTNKIKPTHPGIPLAEKIMRPLFLTQLIFAGYMSCTSIFNFLDLMGYEYFTKVPFKVVNPQEINLTAACQRYYVLGHAALVHGMLAFYSSSITSPYKVHLTNWPLFFIKFGVISSIVGFGFSKVGGLSILAVSIEGIAFVSSTIGLALSIPLRKTGLMFLAGGIFVSTLLRALTSGFKEPVIVSFLMLGIFLYPFYKRLILLTFIPLMLLLFTVLPTYVNSFRAQRGDSDQDAETAKAEALQQVRESMQGDALAENNWTFLTGRLSEISMFVKYKENIDAGGDYYGLEIMGQTLVNLVPRIFWKDKPLTEQVVAKRVLENGIIEEYAPTSAKPQYIVDGYLSFGAAGVWFFLFLYGALAQLISNHSEKLFGGYLFGVAFVFTGMMNCLWRGNCFEYIFNNIFYGFLCLVTLSLIFKRLGILQKKA